YILDQCLDELRAGLKAYIAQKTARRDWGAALDQAATVDELFAAAKNLVKQSLLDKKRDMPALQPGIGAAVQGRLQRPGGTLFLPEGPFKDAFGLHYFSHPTYYGIEADTQFARTVFESDVALKTLAGPRGHKLSQKLGYHRTLIEWIIAHKP